MDFSSLIYQRQSCRGYDESREVEKEKLDTILEAARMAPSACNGQPYHFTVCRGAKAKEVAKATQGMGMNKFASQAPVLIVVSEENYVASAAMGAKLKKNDYRSMDIGIAVAYLTFAATTQGLSTCILGWLDDDKLRTSCDLKNPARLVITLGYAADETIRPKKRKDLTELVTFMEE